MKDKYRRVDILEEKLTSGNGKVSVAMMDSISIVLTILNVLIIFFHGCGIWILLRLKNSDISYSQRILIITLSVSEILFGFNKLISHLILKRYQYDYAYKVTTMFSLTMVSFLYFAAMILITLDRFLEFYLNVKYHLYWSGRKTVWSIVICIITSIIFFIIFFTLFITMELDFKRVLYIYLFPVLETFFTILAFGTYTYIFTVYREKTRKRKQMLKDISVKKKKVSVFSLQRSNPIFKIYVPCLIMVTFVLFLVIPDTVYFVNYMLFSNSINDSLDKALWILYRIGFLSDALIYIFCSKAVRKKIKRYWKSSFKNVL